MKGKWTVLFEMLQACLCRSTSHCVFVALRWGTARWTVCLVLLNPPPPPLNPIPTTEALGQPLGLSSFLGPTVGDLVLQADTYGIPLLFMLRGGGVLESCTMVPQWEGDGGGVASEFPHHGRVRICV